jgi:hypothetical protein
VRCSLRLAPRAADEPAEAVAELAQLAGCLPLAISLLARAYARHPSWTLAELTAETQARMLTLAAETDSVAAAFEVSYRYLAPGQQELFRLLGLHPGATIDAYAAAALAGSILPDAARQLDALHGEGLLTEVSYHRYRMHDLIRGYARDLAAAVPVADREQALDRLLDYYQHTAEIIETRLARRARTSPAPAAPPAAVPDLPDQARALTWARTERTSLLGCLDHATGTGQHARIVALTAALSAFLRIDGPFADAVVRHAAAVQAARYLGDRPGQANALTGLGMMRRVTGDYPGAAEALQEALSLSRGLGDRPGQANVLWPGWAAAPWPPAAPPKRRKACGKRGRSSRRSARPRPRAWPPSLTPSQGWDLPRKAAMSCGNEGSGGRMDGWGCWTGTTMPTTTGCSCGSCPARARGCLMSAAVPGRSPPNWPNVPGMSTRSTGHL